MAVQFKFNIAGAKELNAALAELPKAVAKGVLRDALKKAAEPVRAEAERLAPKDTGRFARTIKVKSTLKRNQRLNRTREGDVEMFVGSTSPLAHLLEFGTSTMSARPFLRPAWDRGRQAVLDTLGAELWAALNRAATRLARQAHAGKLSKSSTRFFNR